MRSARGTDRLRLGAGQQDGRGGVTQDGPRPAPSPPCAPSCSAGSFRFVANSNALACEE